MSRRRVWMIHGGLFLATVVSTVVTGGLTLSSAEGPRFDLTDGLLFGLPLMAILTAHEMGHYLQCRKYAVPATLPFFIPLPVISPFGTLGAIIRMRGGVCHRRSLFDIGVSGPLAGLAIALPVTIVGLAHSSVVTEKALSNASDLFLGPSLLFVSLIRVVLGAVPEGGFVQLHPLATAGWAGLFVTALNLVPVGQLDGGHLLFALARRKAFGISLVVMALFAAVAVLLFPGWTPMIVLILLFGLRHPPVADEAMGLGRARWAVGILTLLFFFVSFTPVPFAPSVEPPPAEEKVRVEALLEPPSRGAAAGASSAAALDICLIDRQPS